jgi:pyridoxamine 5'-phosphate oxidase
MMTIPLFHPIPDFDQPIAVLKHCHDKIRKQIATLKKLLIHLPQHGATMDAQQAAGAVLQYFDKAAALHHADEENDLMPMLQATAEGEDAALLDALVPEIMADHRQMDQIWRALKGQLAAIAGATAATLSADDVARFADYYAAHMLKEETQLAPMAIRLFSSEQMVQLGEAMQQRRNTPVAAPAGAGELAAVREDLRLTDLSEAALGADPMIEFGKWLAQAFEAGVAGPDAMCASTIGADGKPDSRMVLLAHCDRDGFTWHTSYRSQMGRQLDVNPDTALLFYWHALERQVRIEGKAVKASEQESDAGYYSSALASRLAAIASVQSAPIGSRDELDARFAATAASQGEQPQRPPHWGAYRLTPERIEFWQGRAAHVDDRIVYTLQGDGGWLRQRLQP